MDIMLVQCLANDPMRDSRFQGENLALGYLSAVLRRAGYEVGVLDAHLAEMSHAETVARIMEADPMMVGFSASAQESIHSTFELIDLLREEGYGRHITVGGHFPTYEHVKLLENVRSVDSVVRGEGEETIVEMVGRLRQGETLEGVAGVTYRGADGKIVVNPPRALIDNLDELPFPHRDTLPLLLKNNRRVSILASRGCYARCSFCSIQTFFNYTPRRVRSTDNVVREMAELYRQGVRKFRFVDDLFMDPSPRSRAWVLDLIAKIKAAGLTDLNLWLQVRAACVDLEIFRQLVEVGLKKVFLGLESGAEETLIRYRKGHTPEQNVKAIRILEQAGVPEIAVGMMIFEPDVSLQAIKENIHFLKEIGHFHLSNVASRFIPYSGTPLTEKLEKEGRIRRSWWADPGTYDFADPKVSQLYDMVKAYEDLSESSTKLTYDLDIELRKLERHFMGRPEMPLYDAYTQLRKDVEAFTFDHGRLMLELVEETVRAVEEGLAPQDQETWYARARKMFADAEAASTGLFARMNDLWTRLNADLVLS